MVINLVRPAVSSIKYTVSKFPDGQQSITIDVAESIDFNTNGKLKYTDPVVIASRLNSFKDLELIICANQCIRELGATSVKLYVPYFLGARSDRKFGVGDTNYLKNVICPIINSQNFSEVAVVDPHSDVLEACLNNYRKIDNFELVRFALSDIHISGNVDLKDMVLVSPDAGAFKKIFDVAKRFNIENIITATKVRDIKTGDILHTDVPNIDQINKKTYVIVDDICDGGRTFIEIAKTIHNVRPTAKIYLIVTHGIFSAGLYYLKEHFERVYSTNSVKDIEAAPYSDFTVEADFLKQINVF